jgi:hypothetical protein
MSMKTRTCLVMRRLAEKSIRGRLSSQLSSAAVPPMAVMKRPW